MRLSDMLNERAEAQQKAEAERIRMAKEALRMEEDKLDWRDATETGECAMQESQVGAQMYHWSVQLDSIEQCVNQLHRRLSHVMGDPKPEVLEKSNPSKVALCVMAEQMQSNNLRLEEQVAMLRELLHRLEV